MSKLSKSEGNLIELKARVDSLDPFRKKFKDLKIERVQFPLFKGYGRAYEFKRVFIKRKKKGLWDRMISVFNPSPDREPQYDISYGPDSFEQEDDEMLEEVNDLEI